MEEEAYADLDDEALVRESLAHPDGPAAAVLIARWQDRVYQWAYHVVRDPDTALDVAQDALLRVFRSLPSYVPRGRFGAWVFAIVHNRARTVVGRRSLLWDPEVDVDSLAGGAVDPEHEFAETEWEQRVLDAMRDVLEPEERMALWLRSYEGLGMDEITTTLGLRNASGARGLLQTARRKLRRALAPLGEPESGR